MKKYLAILGLALLGLCVGAASAQVTQESVSVQNTAPTGACSISPLVKVSNIGTYQCVGGVWTLVGPSVGGDVVTSVFGRTGSVTAQTGDYSATQISGLGTAATANLGTSGPTIPLLSLGNTWVGAQYFSTGIATNLINNTASSNNASIGLATTGATISRNVADANAAATIAQTNASSTGNITNFSNNTGVVASISQSGAVVAPVVNVATAYQRSGRAVQTVVSGLFTTTAVSSETYTLAGVTSGSGCTFSPQNAAAATHLSVTYWNGAGVDTVVFTHDPTGGDVYFVMCTVP